MTSAQSAGTPQWNPTESQRKVFQEWKTNTIQHLVSCKKGIQPFKLPGMLREVTDESVPIHKMGFDYSCRNINVFLYEMRDALEVRKVDDKLYVFVKESSVPAELQHIRKMVLGQKGKADKPLRHHGLAVPATHLLRYGTGRPEEPPQQSRRRGGYRPNSKFMSARAPTSNNFRGRFPNQPRPFVRPSGTGLKFPAAPQASNNSLQSSTGGVKAHFTNAIEFINLGNPNSSATTQRFTTPNNRSSTIASPWTTVPATSHTRSSTIDASLPAMNNGIRAASSNASVPRTTAPMAPRTVTNTPSTVTTTPTIPRRIPKADDIYDWGTPPPTPRSATSASQYSKPVRKSVSSLAQRYFPDVYGDEDDSDESDKFEFYSGPCAWPPQKENSPPAPTPSTSITVKPPTTKPSTSTSVTPPMPKLLSKLILSLPEPLIPEKVFTPSRPTPEPSPQQDPVDLASSAPAIKVGIGSDKRTSFIDAVFNFQPPEIIEESDEDEEIPGPTNNQVGYTSSLAQAIQSVMLPEKITKPMRDEPKTVSDLINLQVKDKPKTNITIRYGYSLDTDRGLHHGPLTTIPKPVAMTDFVPPPPRILNFQQAVMFPPYLVGPPTSFKTFLEASGQLDKYMNSL